MNAPGTDYKKGTILDGMGASLMALLIGLVLSLCLAPCVLANSDAAIASGPDTSSVPVKPIAKAP